MPFRFFYKTSYQKTFDNLSEDDQLLVLKTLEAINEFLQSVRASYGLRIKKLGQSGPEKVFEARVSIDLRIVWKQTKEEVTFALLGNHDDVRRFLKKL